MIYRHNKLPYIAPMVLQNKRIENNQHVIASSLTAGNSVDSLMPGFKVEKGVTFSVKPSDY